MNKKELLELKIKVFEDVLKNKNNVSNVLKEEYKKYPQVVEEFYVKNKDSKKVYKYFIDKKNFVCYFKENKGVLIMNNKYEKYLPLGSVILLKNAKKKLMITGYATIDIDKKDKVYDYTGCLYPEGVISTSKNILFNHKDIEKIFCIGFSDDEQKEFSNKLKSTLTEENIQIMLNKARESVDIESLG